MTSSHSTKFAGHYSRGGESRPDKHYATTYCYSYSSPTGKYGKTVNLPKTSGFATNGRSVAPPSPVDEAAMEDAVRPHPPRPSQRHPPTFGSRPNARVDSDSVKPGTTMYQSSFVGYDPLDGLTAPAVMRPRESGFSQQVRVKAPMNELDDIGAGALTRRPQDSLSRVPRLDVGRAQAAAAASRMASARARAATGMDSGRYDEDGGKYASAKSPSRPVSDPSSPGHGARARRFRSEAVGMTVGRKTESGFAMGNRVVAEPKVFRGSSTYRDSFYRRNFADGGEALPPILRGGEHATGFGLGNKTERAGVPGVLSTNPRDQYPRHIHPKVLARIKARDPVEFTNLLNVDEPMKSLYRAQFEKRVGEGGGLASGGHADWDDVRAHAADLTLEPTTSERIAAARQFIGTKELSSFVRNNQPNIGVHADMVAEAARAREAAEALATGNHNNNNNGNGSGNGDGDGAYGGYVDPHSAAQAHLDALRAEEAARWVTVASSSYRQPTKEFPPPEYDPATRALQASGFQRSVIAIPPAGDDPERRVSAKKRVDL